jgi:K+ transporter
VVSTSCIARTVMECKKKWQDVQGTTVCHTFEIIEHCILTADSQGLRLQTGGGPPPVARAISKIHTFLSQETFQHVQL